MGAEARRSTRATPSRAESSSRRALWYISDSVAPPPEYSIAAPRSASSGSKRKERGVSTFFLFPPLYCFVFHNMNFNFEGWDSDFEVGRQRGCDVDGNMWQVPIGKPLGC